MPPTRRYGLAGCLIGQEPAFRADPTSERNDLPVRSARFPIRANGKPPAGCIPATRRKTREKKQDEFPGYCIRPEAYRTLGRQNRKCGRGESGASASPARPCGARERGRLVRQVSGLRGSAFPGRNAGRTRNICQTRLHTLLHQPFWEVFSAHTFRWLETLWHGAGWKILALGTFGILMHMIGLPNTFPYRNPDKKQGSFL